MRPDILRTRILPWLLTLVLLVGAWGLVKITLPDDAALEPFRTVAEIGKPAITRNLAVTVTDVRAARRVEDVKGWTADGTWLVIELEAASQVTQKGAFLSEARLVIGDRTFLASDRGTTFAKQQLVTGVPRSGSLLFELPSDALTGTGVLQLAIPSGAPSGVPLDGLIELSIDVEALPVEDSVMLSENGWAR